jgi:predicted DNA-binding transcriptional regulator AlpA
MPDHLPAEILRNQVKGSAEAAAFLNFSLSHFRRLYRRGDVPAPIQMGDRKLGWRTGDLIDWVATRQRRQVTVSSFDMTK